MPARPWLTLSQPDPEREYLVLLTALPLKRWRDLGAFFLYTWHIHGQLKRTPGLLGYSMLAHIVQRRFWTLSVWEGEGALHRFVVDNPHDQVVAALRRKMERTHFVRWTIRGSEIPLNWREALAREDTL